MRGLLPGGGRRFPGAGGSWAVTGGWGVVVTGSAPGAAGLTSSRRSARRRSASGGRAPRAGAGGTGGAGGAEAVSARSPRSSPAGGRRPTLVASSRRSAGSASPPPSMRVGRRRRRRAGRRPRCHPAPRAGPAPPRRPRPEPRPPPPPARTPLPLAGDRGGAGPGRAPHQRGPPGSAERRWGWGGAGLALGPPPRRLCGAGSGAIPLALRVRGAAAAPPSRARPCPAPVRPSLSLSARTVSSAAGTHPSGPHLSAVPKRLPPSLLPPSPPLSGRAAAPCRLRPWAPGFLPHSRSARVPFATPPRSPGSPSAWVPQRCPPSSLRHRRGPVAFPPHTPPGGLGTPVLLSPRPGQLLWGPHAAWPRWGEGAVLQPGPWLCRASTSHPRPSRLREEPGLTWAQLFCPRGAGFSSRTMAPCTGPHI